MVSSRGTLARGSLRVGRRIYLCFLGGGTGGFFSILVEIFEFENNVEFFLVAKLS